ncbi:uncharacterized protein EV420DRAFT_1208465 [Desarmillaria tabescens]|uniref:Uncharacterized protein n=1 Tax=Armillaria tabescens TaxID=1929756 RepID=A0AA39JBF4_ARMTA|nr:uncharacterized protein EV420DRAFT_1208465 [Desarmillaria tabescens]KAK0438701.1 hypothetical protein EV420DRAFT_1208465 [Desarmillaria tabescens]
MPYSGGGMTSAVPIPIPGMASSIAYPGQQGPYGGSYGQPGAYGQPGSYPGQPGSYPGQYAGSQYGGGVPMSMHGGGTTYAGSDPGGPMGSGGYVTTQLPMAMRPRSVSMSMPGHYPHTPYSAGGYDDWRGSSSSDHASGAAKPGSRLETEQEAPSP